MTDLFMTVLDLTLKGSFVIAVVWLIRWWLKLFRYPRRFCYLLWGIVLLRLLLRSIHLCGGSLEGAHEFVIIFLALVCVAFLIRLFEFL